MSKPTKLLQWIALLGGVAVLGASTAIGALSTNTGSSAEEDAADGSQVVPVRLDEVPLVCPPTILNPAKVTAARQETQVSADAKGSQGQTWAPGDPQELTGGGTYRIIEGSLAREDIAGIGIAGVGKGDLVSFTVQSCALPSQRLAFSAGATTVGEDTVLVISNPSDKSADIELEIFDESGPLLDAPVSMTVGAKSTVTALPGVWASGLVNPMLTLKSDGAGITAWLQTSALDGEVPLGLAQIQGAVPDKNLTLTGVSSTRDSTLRIGNLGEAVASVSVTLLMSEDAQPLEGAQEIHIPGQSTVAVDLGSLPSGARALQITGDQDLVATVTETTEGKAHPEVRKAKYSTRTVIGAGRSLSSAELPDLAEMVEVGESLGFSDIEVGIVIANPSSDSVEVELQGASKTLLPGTSASYPLLASTDQLGFEAEEPVYAAIVVTAETRAGTTRSVTALGAEGVLAQSRRVSLFPADQ